jgi:hypothetical protein
MEKPYLCVSIAARSSVASCGRIASRSNYPLDEFILLPLSSPSNLQAPAIEALGLSADCPRELVSLPTSQEVSEDLLSQPPSPPYRRAGNPGGGRS